jgi:transposase
MAPDVAVGIDLGLKTLATLSTGKKIKGPRAFRKYEVKLATAQRARNRQRIRALHAKITIVRRDHMHKWTARVARRFRTVFAGDVSSSRLAKTRLAKSVLDASWTDARTNAVTGGQPPVEESRVAHGR